MVTRTPHFVTPPEPTYGHAVWAPYGIHSARSTHCLRFQIVRPHAGGWAPETNALAAQLNASGHWVGIALERKINNGREHLFSKPIYDQVI